MPSKYTYQFTPSASEDLDAILGYIANELHAPDSAVDLLDAITEAIELACVFPESHALIADPLLALRGYRRIVVKSYLVIYAIDSTNEVLRIISVVYGARDYLKDL